MYLKKRLTLILLLSCMIYTCVRDNTLYNQNSETEPVKCSAFISRTAPISGTPADTADFSICDTFQTFDTIIFMGVIVPASSQTSLSLEWDFGDNTDSDSAVSSHVYQRGGTYNAVFSIRDNSGFMLCDTVTAVINTPPQIPLLFLPDSGKNNVNPEIPLLFRWSGNDADGDDLSYLIRLDTVSPPQRNLMVQPDTEYNLDANSLHILTTYYWDITAFDKFNDSTVSSIGILKTRDPNPSTTGTLTGIVLRENRTSSRGILVSAIRNQTTIATAFTDSTGAYTIKDIPSGKATLIFTDKTFFKPETLQTVVTAGEISIISRTILQDIYPPSFSFSFPAKVKVNASVRIHFEAHDTLYDHIDSITADFGDGFRAIDTNDTTLSFSSPGKNIFRFRAFDINGNEAQDSITIVVNAPPKIPSLIAPVDYADLNTGIISMRWSCTDDDDENLNYDVFLVRHAYDFDTASPFPKNLGDTSFQWTATAGDVGSWYWMVKVFDEFDTSLSTVDSFRISQGTGIIEGYVFRQGKEGTGHNGGIQVTASKSGVVQGSTTTDTLGAYTFGDLSGTVTVTARDYGFRMDSISIGVLNGITNTGDSIVLRDTLPPLFVRTADTTIKNGTSVNISFGANDTFYTIDSLTADYENGFENVTEADTLIVFTGAGDHIIKLRAVDENGNTGRDSITVHVNFAPDSVVLKNPLSDTRVEVNSSPVFSWRASDFDNAGALRYNLYIGTSRILKASDIVVQALSDSSYNEWNSGNISRPYFWKISAYDGYDTTESTTDSLNVGRYTVGHIYGWAQRKGVRRHNGIRITLHGNQDYTTFTNDSGFIPLEVEPGTYSIVAEDTLRSGFESAAGNVTVIAGDSASFDTLMLEDVHPPVITCISPAQDSTLKTLNSRDLVVQGVFTDTGSQVHTGSVHVTMNGTTVTNVSRTSSSWQFSVANIPDGRYSVEINAADSAGNTAIPVVRTFSINSKTISTLIRFYHDTLYCTASVANINPKIRAYYWNFNKHALPAWNDSTLTDSASAAAIWPLPDPSTTGADTLIVMAVDDSGMAVYDTVPYVITDDLPAVHAGIDTTVAMNSSLTLQGSYDQQFGKASRYDWSVNGSSFFRTSSPDTTFTVPDRYIPEFRCVLQVTDDRGNVVRDTMLVTAGLAWESLGGADFTSTEADGNFALGVYSDDEMYLACKDPSNSYKIKVLKWDGTVWTTVGTGFSAGRPTYIQMAVGSGMGSGGGSTYNYSVPYVAFTDFGDSRTKVCKPNGDTVGTWSAINGWTNPISFIIPSPEGSITPYLAFADHSSSDRVRVKKYALGYSPNDWDTVGTFASAPSMKVRTLAANSIDTYVLVRGSMADTLKKLNTASNTWQTLANLYLPNNPAIAIFNGQLYYADRDNNQGGRLSLKRYNGGAMEYAGGGAISENSISYHFSGSVGMIGIQSMGNILMIAYCEYDESGIMAELKIKSWDGTMWRTAGLTGLPSGNIDISQASFAVRNNKPYICYRSGNMLTVLRLR